jgi:hypothetical protein
VHLHQRSAICATRGGAALQEHAGCICVQSVRCTTTHAAVPAFACNALLVQLSCTRPRYADVAVHRCRLLIFLPYVGQEYTGIDWARLQKMEARLRNDILREAGAMGGRLLVARELTHGGRALPGGDMEDDFETIAGAGIPSPLPCSRSSKHRYARSKRDVIRQTLRNVRHSPRCNHGSNHLSYSRLRLCQDYDVCQTNTTCTVLFKLAVLQFRQGTTPRSSCLLWHVCRSKRCSDTAGSVRTAVSRRIPRQVLPGAPY